MRGMARPTRGCVCAALLAALPLGGCSSDSDTKTVLEPVARLAELAPSLRDAPRACAVGSEIRPALGCTTTMQVARATIRSPEGGTVSVPVRIPGSLIKSRVILEASVRDRKESTMAHALVEPGTRSVEIDVANPAKKPGKELRTGVLAYRVPPPEQSYQTTLVSIPENAILMVGLGSASPVPGLAVPPSTFELIAESGQDKWTLLSETLAPDASTGWQNRRIDLAELAGKEVRFTLNSSAPTKGDEVSFPLWGSPEILAPRPQREARNLVLISLDTVRADHVGGSFAGVQLTPRFDELAAQGTVFREAIAPYNATTASHMTLFTGVYPVLHEVTHPVMRLPDSISTLAETLARKGFQTSAVTEDAMISATSGFNRGFDFYRENRDVIGLASSVEQTVQQGIDWLDSHQGQRFFLFLHTYAAHSPYVPPKEFLELFPDSSSEAQSDRERRFGKIKRSYAAEVRYADATFAKLFAAMERLGVLRDTVVVVTADHGEELGEHGLLGHAKTVYDEVTRVPLIFWAPGLVPSGAVVEDEVSLVDVMPTILELLRIDVPAGLHGVSLLAAMNGKTEGLGATRFAEGRSEDQAGKRLVTARTREHKWILSEGQDEPKVFDLRSDPGEQRPLDDPALQAEGKRLLDGYEALGEGRAQHKSAAPPAVDEETQKKLEALGYVDGH